jgi:hypothetical protein
MTTKKPVTRKSLKAQGDKALGMLKDAVNMLKDAVNKHGEADGDEDGAAVLSEDEDAELDRAWRGEPAPSPSPAHSDSSAGLGLSYESALRQVARLLKLSERAATPQEAAVAAAKAQTLMERFQIEKAIALESQEAKERKPDEPVKHFDDQDAFDVDFKTQIPHWRWRLAQTILMAHGCYAYIGHTRYRRESDHETGKVRYAGGTSTIAVIGRKSDVEAARYVYQYALRECDRLVSELPSGQGKTWRNNFRLGLVDAIRDSLHDAKEQLKSELREHAADDPVDPKRALTIVNSALKRREDVVEDARDYGKRILHLRSRGSGVGGAHDYSARMAGHDAGSGISMTKAKGGIGSGNKRIK